MHKAQQTFLRLSRDFGSGAVGIPIILLFEIAVLFFSVYFSFNELNEEALVTHGFRGSHLRFSVECACVFVLIDLSTRVVSPVAVHKKRFKHLGVPVGQNWLGSFSGTFLWT